MPELNLKDRIRRLKAYIQATEREIRQLQILRAKYLLEERHDHAKEANSHIEVRIEGLTDARRRLASLSVNTREIVTFT